MLTKEEILEVCFLLSRLKEQVSEREWEVLKAAREIARSVGEE